MAKAKMHSKKEADSPFVSVEEQPYEVPENWCWIRGGNLLASMETQKPTGTEFDYIDIDAIDNQKQVVTVPKRTLVSEAPSRASRKLHAGDTLFSMVRPYLKNIAYIDESLSHCIASTGFFVCTPKSILNSHYLYQLMISPYMVDGLNQYMKGDNSPSIRKDDIENFPFPIPPFSEQQRIVDRIESLFAKLDEAKEKAQAVVDGFELRKSAILHKAFTGELTAKWRKKHGGRLADWHKTTLGQIASFHQGVQIPVDEQESYPFANSVRFIRIVDYTQGTEDVRYVDSSNIRKDALVSGNEIVMVRYGATAGYVGDKISGLIANNMFVVDVSEQDREYIKVFLRSPQIFSLLNTSGGSSAMPALNFKTVSAVEISIPPKEEQVEIVKICLEIETKTQRAKETAEAVLDQIDTMKKAILARAFRGELGTNNPNEESAAELLKKI